MSIHCYISKIFNLEYLVTIDKIIIYIHIYIDTPEGFYIVSGLQEVSQNTPFQARPLNYDNVQRL